MAPGPAHTPSVRPTRAPAETLPPWAWGAQLPEVMVSMDTGQTASSQIRGPQPGWPRWPSHHSCDLIVRLQILHDLGLVGRLHSGKAAGATAGLPLLAQGQVVELPASVGSACHILILPKDANSSADGNGRALVVPSNHDHSDSSITAQLDGARDLLAGRVQHTHHTNECQVHLGSQSREPPSQGGTGNVSTEECSWGAREEGQGAAGTADSGPHKLKGRKRSCLHGDGQAWRCQDRCR